MDHKTIEVRFKNGDVVEYCQSYAVCTDGAFASITDGDTTYLFPVVDIEEIIITRK